MTTVAYWYTSHISPELMPIDTVKEGRKLPTHRNGEGRKIANACPGWKWRGCNTVLVKSPCDLRRFNRKLPIFIPGHKACYHLGSRSQCTHRKKKMHVRVGSGGRGELMTFLVDAIRSLPNHVQSSHVHVSCSWLK